MGDEHSDARPLTIHSTTHTNFEQTSVTLAELEPTVSELEHAATAICTLISVTVYKNKNKNFKTHIFIKILKKP